MDAIDSTVTESPSIDEFYLNPKKIHEILKAKGIESLYHANTILTSLTFIQQRALLTRGHVEKNGLYQTEQKSDSDDKKFDVWDDAFLDAIDLHKKYRRANLYGPALFVMKLDLLLAPELPKLLVTRNNPWFWKNEQAWKERYYDSEDGINNDYLCGKLDSRIMFTLRSPGNFIKLNKYLKEIILDKPKIYINFSSGEQRNVGDNAFMKLREAMDANGLKHIPISFRHDNDGIHYCSCYINYNYWNSFKYSEFATRFKTVVPT